MDTHNLKYIISFLLLILLMGGCSKETDTSGCPFPDSCNYNPDGIDEDSCWYANEGCLCEDGQGVIKDECGICGGGGSEENFDCDGNCIADLYQDGYDCAGICGGDAREDCNGVCNGDGVIDDCANCSNNFYNTPGDSMTGWNCGQNNIDCSDVDCLGVCYGNALIDECGVCNGVGVVSTEDWNIQIITSMQPWAVLDWISDEENYLGVSEYASDDYDSMDIPDPPIFDTNWIKAYFYHPEWDSAFGDNFTQEYKSNEFCETKEWDFNIEANSQGPLTIEFIFNNVPENLYIEIIEEDIIQAVSGNSIIETTLQSNVPKEFLIRVSVD